MRKNKEAAAKKAASGETQPAYKAKMAAPPKVPSYSGGGGGGGGGRGGGSGDTDARLAAIEAKLDKIMRHLNIPN